MTNILKVYDPQKHRDINAGEIVNNKLIKTVDPKKHFMRRVNGYGIQEVAFTKLLGLKVTNIIIKEQGTGEEWVSTLDQWLKLGKVADYGAGKQRFLSIKYMISGKALKEASKQKKLL